jgi:hypothetical protein
MGVKKQKQQSQKGHPPPRKPLTEVQVKQRRERQNKRYQANKAELAAKRAAKRAHEQVLFEDFISLEELGTLFSTEPNPAPAPAPAPASAPPPKRKRVRNAPNPRSFTHVLEKCSKEYHGGNIDPLVTNVVSHTMFKEVARLLSEESGDTEDEAIAALGPDMLRDLIV